MRRQTRIALVILLGLWGLSWIFARDIVKGLEALGVLPRRGIVFSDASDFAFSLVVLAGLLALWATWRLFSALSGREGPAADTVEADPRDAELRRQIEQLLRDLKDLEFDRDLRKISPEDYAPIEQRLRREAKALLQALDEIDPVRLYGDRIREDLRRYLEQPPVAPEASSGTAAPDDDAWREEVLGRPLYRDLALVLGEDDLLRAARRGLWIVDAEVDCDRVEASDLTVEDRARGERFHCTLGELRSRLQAGAHV